MALPDQELIALLTDPESDRVEPKETAANSDRLSEAICAFANDMPGYGQPGVLFVGVSDNGAVLGRPVTDELLLRLADLRDQGTILPPPTMTVRKLRIGGGEVAVVEVRPSMTPPVRFKGRYPALADLLRGLGYVQRFGMGLPSAHRSLKANGNPLPEFTVTDSYVSVIIRRRP